MKGQTSLEVIHVNTEEKQSREEMVEDYEECMWRERIQYERKMSIIALSASTLALVVNIVLRVLKMML